MDDSNDTLHLPADTLKLLHDFTTERDERTRQFERLEQYAEDTFQQGPDGGSGNVIKLSMDLFTEDWNVSQFWFTDETARTFATQLLDSTNQDSAIAVISAPSVYIQLRNILSEQLTTTKPKICLLEYDHRFEVLGSDYVHYDFEHPLRLPQELEGRFDRIICDPPFFSPDCQTKTAQTVRYLARSWTPTSLRLISCTGERMQPVVTKLYGSVGVQTTSFEPEHSRGLSNEYKCYANFECEGWRWLEQELPN